MNLLVAVILTEFAETDVPPDTARTARSDTSRDTSRTDRSEAASERILHVNGTDENAPWPENHSLFIFGPRNPLRTFLRGLIKKPQFDQVVIAAIIISSICLAVDSPRLDPASDTAGFLKKLDLFFTLLFFCEMMSKIITLGFVFGKVCACHACHADAYAYAPATRMQTATSHLLTSHLLTSSSPHPHPHPHPRPRPHPHPHPHPHPRPSPSPSPSPSPLPSPSRSHSPQPMHVRRTPTSSLRGTRSISSS